MRPTRTVCVLLTIYCIASFSSLFAQTPKKPAFEVATVKPIPSMQSLFEEIRSGKRSQDSLKTTVDGARVDIGASPMMELITRAYKVRSYQVIGGPDWLNSMNYEIHAKLPEGASRDQIPEMLQSLLEERFKLVAHRENKEQPVYLLTVSKSGHKLKEASADADAPAQADDPATNPSPKDGPDKSATTWAGKKDDLKVSRDGTLSTQNFRMRMVRDENGALHMEQTWFKIRMSEMAQNLSFSSDRPIVDGTGLTGFYDVSIEALIDRANAGGITGSAPDG